MLCIILVPMEILVLMVLEVVEESVVVLVTRAVASLGNLCTGCILRSMVHN